MDVYSNINITKQEMEHQKIKFFLHRYIVFYVFIFFKWGRKARDKAAYFVHYLLQKLFSETKVGLSTPRVCG